MTGLAARAMACLGALGIIGLAILPPEHVHLGAEHDDHARPEVHRHFQPHHLTTDQTRVESPDDATYLTDTFIVPSPLSVHAPDQPVCDVITEPDVLTRLAAGHTTGRDLRVHDPPWARATGLRGPPQQLA